ncbi:related to PKH1 - ser/thr protein kinases [Ustilago trichophora]|uniref:non-specific serine/threonine protein kinase n=1 Tax=Ustilago trichophora TaxID=86804 RepID=A0A5C3E0U7_9BASI|nr:related to PKH1 - ser/thr protein kinases [Ustilago trichophora]
MSEQPPPISAEQASSDHQQSIFASPTPMDTGFQQLQGDEVNSTTTTQGPPSAAPSASTTPMSAPTPLHAPSANVSATSSAAVSRAGSVRSNAPPSSSGSTTRIRKGLLSRAGSEAEDRISRAASVAHQQLTTDDDDDDPMISDSGPMPRRFASQSHGPTGAASNSRQSSHSSLSPTTWGQRPGAASQHPRSSTSSIASGNRSGSGEASEGGASIGGVSLGRAMSVSSVSSVTSTSSLEAVPFREAPLGNVRLGFGGAGFRAAGRSARNSPYGSLAMSTQPRPTQPTPQQADGQALSRSQEGQDDLLADSSLRPAPQASGALSASAPAADRHKGVPKPASDAWMYRVGPGMRTNKPRAPEPDEQPMEEATSSSSPAKRSREVLRQKFAKGAGRLGIKANIVTGLGPSPSEQFAVYNPLDSSEDELNLIPPMRTPLPRNSSYFTSAPHSASSAAGTPLHSSLTPVPADFRTSSVTNAPLFVPKYAEDAQSARLTPEPFLPSGPASRSPDARLAVSVDSSQAPSLQPLSYAGGAASISSDLSPFLAGASASEGIGISYPRRRSSATQRPVLMRAESSNDALDRTASPGLLVHDPSAAGAPAAEPALFTLSTSASSSQRTPLAGPGFASGNDIQMSPPHPTPAELVRMEAQAGIASLPDSPSEPSPIPASYSPAIGDETASNRRVRDSSQARLRRPSSGTGSEASLSVSAAGVGPSRRPESLQRQRLWSNAKRPAILRARTSESSISRGRRSQSSDRKGSSPGPQSPIEGPMLDGAFDRPGTHSKNSSSSTVPGNELGTRLPPHVSVIPEDDDGGSGSVDTPERLGVRGVDGPSPSPSRPPSGIELDPQMALSPPNGGTLPFMVRPIPGPRSASPASQLARSPETIRVGPARIVDSIYGRSPASISNLRSPRLQPSSASIASDRPTTPSPRTASARGPNDFHFGDTLGEGSYSTVIEAWDLLSGPSPKEPGVVDPNATSAAAAMVGSDSTRKRRRRIDLTGRKAYAIKVLDKVHILKQGKQKYVGIEKEALSRMIRHPGVVTLFWTFQDRESLYFVLELASNGELLNFIRKHGSFDLTAARFYAAQLADTIDAMHRAGVVHRDVKPENILLDARHRIKITDFGSAKIVHAAGEADISTAPEVPPANPQSRAASFVGTAEYVSPELLVEKAQPAGKPADWWAFGCVLFQMIAGRPPFKGVNEYQTLQKVKNRDFTFPEGFPQDAQDLIDKVLTLDPTQRPSATEIKAHRFFEQINFDQLWEVDAPEIKTGLVQPLAAPQQREFGETSDFSFDEGFGSSDESQAYNGDTQSIDYPTREGPDESSLSLDAVPSAQPNDADDSELSDASSNNRETGGGGGGEHSFPRRQSGLQRLADGFQSRFMPNAAGSPVGNNLAVQQGGGTAPRRKFSTMSIDTAHQTVAHGIPENESSVARGLRPFSRSMQTMNVNASASPNSANRNPHPSQLSNGSGGGIASTSAGGLQQSWAALLLPKELMLYSLPVAQKKTGAGKMFTKRRQLVLTDFPRLLCVKETAAALKVKSEVILAIPSKSGENGTIAGLTSNVANERNSGSAAPKAAGEFEKISGRQASGQSDDEVVGEEQQVTATNVRSSQQQAIPNLLMGLEYRGGRAFTIRIANGQTFQYETLSGDASALVRSIQEARRSTT